MNWPKSQLDVLRDYWRKACEYDGISSQVTFAQFSPSNPFVETYSRLLRYYRRSKQQNELLASQGYAILRHKILMRVYHRGIDRAC